MAVEKRAWEQRDNVLINGWSRLGACSGASLHSRRFGRLRRHSIGCSPHLHRRGGGRGGSVARKSTRRWLNLPHLAVGLLPSRTAFVLSFIDGRGCRKCCQLLVQSTQRSLLLRQFLAIRSRPLLRAMQVACIPHHLGTHRVREYGVSSLSALRWYGSRLLRLLLLLHSAVRRGGGRG